MRNPIKNEERQERRKLKVESSLLMLSRNKDIFQEHNDKTPMLLLTHNIHSNHSTFPISYFISLVLQDYDDLFPKELQK